MSVDTSSKNRNGRGGSSPSGPLLGGAIGGAVHAIAAISLWSFFGFESPRGMLSAEPFFLSYTLVGTFALGFVPVFLYVRWGSVSPGLLIGGLFCLSSYGTWSTVIEQGLAPVDPTPFGWYLLLWVVVAALALGVGWVELRFRS